MSDNINARIIELKESDSLTWQEIANIVHEEFGEPLTSNACRGRYRRRAKRAKAKEQYRHTDIDGEQLEETEYDNGDREVYSSSYRITNLKQLLEATKTDLEKWYVSNHVINTWEQHSVKRGLVTLYQIRVWLKPHPEAGFSSGLEKIVEQVRKYAPVYPTIKRFTPRSKEYLLLPCLFDAHIGRRPHDELEKDVSIVYDALIDELLYRSRQYDVEQILFPIGNDLLNIDNLRDSTTKGTAVSQRYSMQSTIDMTCSVVVSAVEKLRTVAPVHVVMVPGNHDRLSNYWLGKVLDAWFSNCHDITVDNGPSPRKYYQWGRSLFGFTHGDEERNKDLVALMAVEVPELWAKSRYREWLMGHLHGRSSAYYPISEKTGVVARVIPALCAPDDWHILKGYVGNDRAAEGYVWSRSSGLEAQFNISVE